MSAVMCDRMRPLGIVPHQQPVSLPERLALCAVRTDRLRAWCPMNALNTGRMCLEPHARVRGISQHSRSTYPLPAILLKLYMY